MDTVNHFALMKAFSTTCRLGSFAAAARSLDIATSTLTRQITQLEQAIGATLLIRTTHGLSLTEAGSLYLERAGQLSQALDDMLREVADIDTVPSGTVRVLCPTAFGHHYLSPLLPELLREFPQIRVELTLSDAHIDLANSGYDLEIQEGEDHLSRLVAFKLGANRMILCASPAYLQQHGTPDTVDDLARHNCLRYTHQEAAAAWELEQDGERSRVIVDGSLHSNNSDVLLRAACDGVGIIESELWHARPYLDSGRLQHVLPGYRSISRLTGNGIYLAYLPNRRLSAKVRAVRDFLLAQLGTLD